jgi:hypothetical protein
MECRSIDVRVLSGSGLAFRLELARWFLKFAWACGLHINCGPQVMGNVANYAFEWTVTDQVPSSGVRRAAAQRGH